MYPLPPPHKAVLGDKTPIKGTHAQGTVEHGAVARADGIAEVAYERILIRTTRVVGRKRQDTQNLINPPEMTDGKTMH